ncbi:MAG: DUF1254 domain-containing protein [Cyclobacteriaceae bacterium]
MKTNLLALTVLVLGACQIASQTEETSESVEVPRIVTEANFTVAETDKYMSEHVKKYPVNTIRHARRMSDKDNQFVIRENQDLMYSHSVVDISNEATLINPPWDVYSIIQVMDENQYTIAAVYPGDTVNIIPSMVALGDHVFLNIRTGVRTLDEEGYAEAHRHQDSIKIIANSANPYVSKNFDTTSLNEPRQRLIARMDEATQPQYYFGTKEEVDSLNFLIASAAGWAGLPIRHATYLNTIQPTEAAKAGECATITLPKPPLEYDQGGFFSVTTYDSTGWIVRDNFALNNRQAEPNEDGTYTFHFNCPGETNNIEVEESWSMLIRLYRPESEEAILDYIKYANENIKVELDES